MIGRDTEFDACAADALTLEVSAKAIIADGVCQLTLREPGGHRLPDWTPGSHIDVILPGDRVRQYSLCGDRWDPLIYQIAVLREADGRGGSLYIHDELHVGDRLRTGGPRLQWRRDAPRVTSRTEHRRREVVDRRPDAEIGIVRHRPVQFHRGRGVRQFWRTCRLDSRK